jgi:hypothetical protein
MAAVPNLSLIPVEEYLAASYPDGDREYLDGVVMERNAGTPGHSALQKILIVHLAASRSLSKSRSARNAAHGSRRHGTACRTCWSWSGRSGRRKGSCSIRRS